MLSQTRQIQTLTVSTSLKQQYQTSHLGGTNAAYVEDQFERWLANPDSVADHWQELFAELSESDEPSHSAVLARFQQLAGSGHYRLGGLGGDNRAAGDDHKQAGVLKLLNAYRVRGHQKAQLDPLGLSHRPEVPDLNLETHDLDQSDLSREFDTGSLAAPERMRLDAIIELLEKTYCRSIGTEYIHITDTSQRRWLQERLEGCQGDFTQSKQTRMRILGKLTAAEGLERYLHTKYVGQKRFSLEGGDSLIPLLHELMLHTGANGTKQAVIGMAHRGRLNVLLNILGKPSTKLFAEFDGTANNGNGAGDVKYHLGYSADLDTEGGSLHMALAFNPSHLEIVDPVVVGSARARQIKNNRGEFGKVLPVLVHGDAAFAGQGVIMELFNMSQARGFAVGGTVHVVVNNQVGFTTSNPLDARSTLYCTEVAKMVQAPIFHVNANDPEAVVFVCKMADDFRQEFQKDVIIDLVCYRRHGHNEADEPSATQPIMYQVIRELPTTRELFANKMIEAGLLSTNDVKQMQNDYRQHLDNGEPVTDVRDSTGAEEGHVDWTPYLGVHWDDAADTTLKPEAVQRIADTMTKLPDDFKLHARVQKVIDDRKKMGAGEIPMDWGFAENVAYASLIEQGHGLRLVGQDSGRGTFFHRHAILHDQNTGRCILPLERFTEDKHNVTVIDSLLSEEAVMGFEYGYASTDPQTMVIWEAQFGDFANGAQVVIDQFITSGETKWGRLCGLTLFLPHGYEGQGPEHSSARLERFLQLCAQDNIQVCIPSLPSQFFHMIRRQMLRPYRKPLVVMTPKSLLRHKASVSHLNELAIGGYQVVLDEVDNAIQPKDVKRLILCSGKVYFDLATARAENNIEDIAIARLEQLYPFPKREVQALFERYALADEVVWCQEEPLNQGAWFVLRDRIQRCLTENQTLSYAGRAELASPAVGYAKAHAREQTELVKDALKLSSSAQDQPLGKPIDKASNQ